MTLGELKIEALRLMFANANDDISVDNIAVYYGDDSYRDYLGNMPGAINRCFSDLEEKRILPSRAVVLDNNSAKRKGALLRFDLDAIKDLFDIERIVGQRADGGYEGDCDFRVDGNMLLLAADDNNPVEYYIIYKPMLKRIRTDTPDAYMLEVPDNIAVHIPYYIKGDLYRDDEPNEASEARNWYEVATEKVAAKNLSKRKGVRSVYSQTGDVL